MDINKICTHCMSEVNGEKGMPCPSCGHILGEGMEITHQLKPLTILQGKYLIGDVLGEGGFGITYIGFDLNLEMKVAIKEFYPNGYASREALNTNALTVYTGQSAEAVYKWRDNFLKEARSLGKCSHLPGVVGVRDFFQENNTAYIVLEYLEGMTLKSYAKSLGGRIPAQSLLPALEPIFIALEEVHRQGLIHRDISPDNIMLLPGGQMKLLDFGAARDYTGGGEKSLSVMLKPGYAPEEQYRSKGKQGPWSDIYALAGTIYKCLTGVTPPEAMERMRADELRRPSELGAGLSPVQEDALLKAMSVFAEGRYQTTEEFRKELYADAAFTQAGMAPVAEAVPMKAAALEQPVVTGMPTETEQQTGTGPSISVSAPASQGMAGPFVQTVLTETFQKYQKQIVGGICGLVLVLLLIFGIKSFNGNGDKPSHETEEPAPAELAETNASSGMQDIDNSVSLPGLPAEEQEVPVELVTENCVDLQWLIYGLAFYIDVEDGEIRTADMDEEVLGYVIKEIMVGSHYYDAVWEENEAAAVQAGQESALSTEQMDYVASSITGSPYHFTSLEGHDYFVWSQELHAMNYEMENYVVEVSGYGEWIVTTDYVCHYSGEEQWRYKITALVRYNPDSCFDGFSVISVKCEDAADSQSHYMSEQEEDTAIHRYELIVEDVTWTEAYRKCIERGGYLARINTYDEFLAVTEQIRNEDKKSIVFWLGATRAEDSSEYYWIKADGSTVPGHINSEEFAYAWLPGEPSFSGQNEAGEEVEEQCIEMFYRSLEDRFYWNDVPDDLLAGASFYTGKIGYICEYEN